MGMVSITQFQKSSKNGLWYWTTHAANGEPVGGSMGEGYKELRKAVTGFFAQQGTDPTDSAYSDTLKINDNLYLIEKRS